MSSTHMRRENLATTSGVFSVTLVAQPSTKFIDANAVAPAAAHTSGEKTACKTLLGRKDKLHQTRSLSKVGI
eukprot:4500633-Pleurochrysis_carterae.AAC.2